MANTEHILYVYSCSGRSYEEGLSEWLAALEADHAPALAYSREKCQLLLVHRGGTLEHPDQPVTPYELRAFLPQSEFRWIDAPDPAGQHRAVVLSDVPLPLPDGWAEDQLEYTDTLDQEYLLWGSYVPRDIGAGWSMVGEARVGALSIPTVPERPGLTRAVITTREYVVADPIHGNAIVTEERLAKLEYRYEV